MIAVSSNIKRAAYAGAGGLALGGLVGYLAGKSSSKKKKRSKRSKAKLVRKRSRFTKKKGQRYTPHTAGRRRDTSRRRIRYTKNGQPYIILRSGKARFIKKRSAKSSHKRRGGRY